MLWDEGPQESREEVTLFMLTSVSAYTGAGDAEGGGDAVSRVVCAEGKVGCPNR